MRRSVAHLPLHGGKAPRWLFERMMKLAGAITMTVVDEYGPREMLRRLSDPWWFQAFGCVLGFDWHSSGVTTVTCGALKEAARLYGDDLGVLVAGGKGRTSRRAPREIEEGADRHGIAGGERLVYASRMSAKVDSAAVQDGYQVYHHTFFFEPGGGWCVVQQGMNGASGWARRYHWLGEILEDFVCDPHASIQDLSRPAGAPDRADRESPSASGGEPREPASAGPTPSRVEPLNMVAREGRANRDACAALAREDPDRIAAEVRRLTEGPTLFAPAHHAVLPEDVDARHLQRVLRTLHERHPEDFETLLGGRGVGPAAVRSLALVAEVIHDAPVSRADPADRAWARFSFAHGGKDGHPFPVDRSAYDRSIEVLEDTVRRARLGDREKSRALRRLARWAREAGPRASPSSPAPGRWRGPGEGRISEPRAGPRAG